MVDNDEDVDRIGHLRWLVLVGISTEAAAVSSWCVAQWRPMSLVECA